MAVLPINKHGTLLGFIQASPIIRTIVQIDRKTVAIKWASDGWVMSQRNKNP